MLHKQRTKATGDSPPPATSGHLGTWRVQQAIIAKAALARVRTMKVIPSPFKASHAGGRELTKISLGCVKSCPEPFHQLPSSASMMGKGDTFLPIHFLAPGASHPCFAPGPLPPAEMIWEALGQRGPQGFTHLHCLSFFLLASGGSPKQSLKVLGERLPQQ